MNGKDEATAWGTAFGIIGSVCAIVSLFVCWWLGFVAIAFGGVALAGKSKVAGAVSMGLGCVALIITAIVFATLR